MYFLWKHSFLIHISMSAESGKEWIVFTKNASTFVLFQVYLKILCLPSNTKNRGHVFSVKLYHWKEFAIDSYDVLFGIPSKFCLLTWIWSLGTKLAEDNYKRILTFLVLFITKQSNKFAKNAGIIILFMGIIFALTIQIGQCVLSCLLLSFDKCSIPCKRPWVIKWFLFLLLMIVSYK